MAAHSDSQSLLMKSLPMEEAKSHERGWSPYTDNGGTVLALAGPNYAILGGDTRMSSGYNIMTREDSKLKQLNGTTVLGSAGMQAERIQLRKVLEYKIEMYRHKNRKEIDTPSVAQLLSNTLYQKRFFPFYTFNALAGLDKEGRGAAYGYDAVGSFERVPYVVEGSSSALITSILDNQVGFKTVGAQKRDLALEEALDIVKDCFAAASERDIYCGDRVQIAIITRDGITWDSLELRKD